MIAQVAESNRKDVRNAVEVASKALPGLVYSEVILGQNCVRLSDAALDDLFFSKTCFIKSSVNML